MAEPAGGWRELAGALETLGAEMLRQARQDDWEAVAGLEIRRRALARQLFAGALPAGAAPQLRAVVTRLLEQQATLVELGRRRHDALGAELGRCTRGRKARHAYGGG